MFTGFREDFINTGEASIFVRHGGDGSVLLLLHGHPPDVSDLASSGPTAEFFSHG